MGLRHDVIYAVASSPTFSDDITAGYQIGDDWKNTVTGVVYMCIDNAAAAAVWSKLLTANSLSTESVPTVNGGILTYVSPSTITIGTTAITSYAKSSDNTFLIIWTGTLSLDITVSGIGGLDTGVEAANTWYAVYVIGDSTGVLSPVALFSTSFTAPTLPIGYDKFRRLGAVRNNASSNFLIFRCADSGMTREVWYTQDIAGTVVLNAGTATVRTAINCSSVLPPTSRQIKLNCQFRNDAVLAAAADFFILYVTGVTAIFSEWIGAPGIKSTTTIGQLRTMEMPTDAAQSIDYLVANINDSLSLTIQGYTDNL